jgi:hypothetical protein
MTITKSGTRVTLTADGSDGYDWTTAYDMDDILAASDVGGWGMTKVYDTYFVPFTIWIDADTYFNMYLIARTLTVVFTGAVRDDVYSYYSDLNSHTRIGRDLDFNDQYCVHWKNDPEVPSGNRRTYFGGDVTIANLSLQLSHYTYVVGNATNQAVCKNTTFNNLNFGLNVNDYSELYNVQVNVATYGFWVGGNPIMQDCKIINASIGMLASNPYQRAEGLKVYNTESWDTYLRAAAGDKQLELVDCEMEKSKLYFYNSGTTESLSEQWLITTMTLNITDANKNIIPEADVLVLSAAGETLFSGQTDVNGKIDGQEVKYFYKWRIADSTGTLDEGETDYEPLSIHISKDGYDPVSLNEVYVTKGVPTVMNATLLAEGYDGGLTNAYETESVRHLFLNEAIPKIGDTGGLQPSAADGSLYVALLTASPGEAGSIANEADYGGYARVAVPRGSAGWTELNGQIYNFGQINFPEVVDNPNTVTYFAVMKEATGSDMIAYSQLVEGKTFNPTDQPQFGPMALNFKIG